MKRYRIVSHRDPMAETIAVARGEIPAPADAGTRNFESIDVLLGFPAPENRALLAPIRDRKPRSITGPTEMTGLGEPALTDALAKLEAVGFVRMETVAGRKAPVAAVTSVRVEIDPFSRNDRVDMV